jgi:hypothetical protein
MATPASPQSQYCVRQMSFDDIHAVIQLQLDAFPGQAPWRPEQLERHLEVFPEGFSQLSAHRLG